MKKQIAINQQAIDNAAMWIKQNNSYMKNKSLVDLTQSIQACVDRVVKRGKENWEMNYSGTAGFTVFFMPEDESYGIVEVLVDPAVGGEYEFEIIWEGK